MIPNFTLLQTQKSVHLLANISKVLTKFEEQAVQPGGLSVVEAVAQPALAVGALIVCNDINVFPAFHSVGFIGSFLTRRDSGLREQTDFVELRPSQSTFFFLQPRVDASESFANCLADT